MGKSAALFLVTLGWASTAHAVEPWIDPDPAGPPERYKMGEDFGIRINSAEYRAQYTFVNPISLNER